MNRGILAAAMWLLAGLGREAVRAAEAGAPDAAELVEFQTNWPRFRGWDGSGVSMPANNAGNVAWRAAIPAPGHSSPVVWGDRVFISGGTAERREVFCYQAAGGALLWRRAVEKVPGSPASVPEIFEDPGYATPTMATDGRRVYVMFANADLAALDFNGAVVWTKYVGPLANPYGFAASLAVWRNDLIVQLDQGESAAGASKLAAFDGASGRVLWERSRPVPASWATPIIVEAAGKTQIITLANPWVTACAESNGAELWRAQLLEGDVVPSPVVAGGLVVLLNPGSKLLAVRPDGAGDVTKTGVAWSADENVPDIPSPVSNGDLVFTVTGGGIVSCFEAKTGEKIWWKNLGTEVQASPSVAGGRLLILGEHGEWITLEAGRQFRETARIRLPDRFLASPAFAGDRIFLRGTTNLFCLGPGGGKGKE